MKAFMGRREPMRASRFRLTLIGVVATLVAGVAVGLATSATAGSVQAGKVKIFFIIPELANPYWIPGKQGAEDAAKKNNVDLHVVGTPIFNVQQQIALLKSAQTAGAQGIILVPADPVGLNNEIAKARARGIPVVASILDAPKSKRNYFTGSDVVLAGSVAGRNALKELNKRNARGVIPTVITTCAPGTTGQEGFRKGFTNVVTKQNPYKSKFQIKVDAYLNTTPEPAKSLALHKDALLAHPDVKLWYAMCGITTQTAGQAIKAAKRRDVVVAGMAWLPGTLKLIDEGWIAFAVGEQNYEAQVGAVKALARFARGEGPLPKGKVILPSPVATKANLAAVRKSPNSKGG